MSLTIVKTNPITQTPSTSPFCSTSALDAFYNAPFYPSPFYACAETNFPSLFSENDVREYLNYQKAPFALKSSKELAARKIEPVRISPKINSFSHYTDNNARMIDKRFQFYGEAAHEYLKLARLPLPPHNRAILFNQARNALEQQIKNFGVWRHEQTQIEEQIKELSLQEAQACLEAALQTKDRNEKFALLQNGIMQLPNNEELWSALGTLVLNVDNFDFKLLPQLEALLPPFKCSYSRDYFAAQCFLNAGEGSIKMGHTKQALQYFSNAHTIFKGIIAEKQHRPHIEEQILRVHSGNFHAQYQVQPIQKISTLEYVTQALRTADLYGELGEDQTFSTYDRASHLMKQSLILQRAALLTKNSKERVELYEKALTIAKKALLVDHFIRHNERLFSRDYIETLSVQKNEARKAHAKALEKLIKQNQQQKKAGIVKQIFSKLLSFF